MVAKRVQDWLSTVLLKNKGEKKNIFNIMLVWVPPERANKQVSICVYYGYSSLGGKSIKEK